MNETNKNNLSPELQEKLSKLEDYIRGLGSLAIGFSGGVDSTLLLTVAHKVLGEKALAVTAKVASVPAREIKEATDFCAEHGIRHIICEYDPLTIDEFKNNHPERCYFCKLGIFSEIKRIAKEAGVEYVAEGSNMDDLGDYRPGLRAVDELKVVSPLREAALYKSEIRAISKALDLPTWDKPSYACLASRFVYGEEITEEKLRMVEEAEEFLITHGFIEERVRIHGDMARIEVPPKDIPRLAADGIREELARKLKELGFRFVTLDMQGYRTGSMNETIS